MQDAVVFDLQLVLQVSVAKAFFINRFAVLADQYLGSRAEAVAPYAEKIIELCRATPEEAALLAVKKGDYLLFVRSTAYDRDGEPVYAGVQVINGDRFALRVYESDGE